MMTNRRPESERPSRHRQRGCAPSSDLRRGWASSQPFRLRRERPGTRHWAADAESSRKPLVWVLSAGRNTDTKWKGSYRSQTALGQVKERTTEVQRRLALASIGNAYPFVPSQLGGNHARRIRSSEMSMRIVLSADCGGAADTAVRFQRRRCAKRSSPPVFLRVALRSRPVTNFLNRKRCRNLVPLPLETGSAIGRSLAVGRCWLFWRPGSFTLDTRSETP
jgi:hypothetical protein